MTIGDTPLKLGLLLDPMGAAMLAMVAFVALWIFIYSLGYMKDEARFGRFFGFLSLFSGAMLLVVLSNSLLLLFMAWELVGLASYLLIGFYFEKPSAAAAAQKAFITTRVGDMAFFLGMIWLYRQTGTLLVLRSMGRACWKPEPSQAWPAPPPLAGSRFPPRPRCSCLAVPWASPARFRCTPGCPTPWKARRRFPRSSMPPRWSRRACFWLRASIRFSPPPATAPACPLSLSATAWIGGITALFAALVAVAQSDIKRILAYSTVSQLGFMMVALGTGGVAAAMFHLIAHAFFKALLFLSAGSVIHGCHGSRTSAKWADWPNPCRGRLSPMPSA